MKKCPYCAENIQDEAIVCRYCGRELEKIKQAIPWWVWVIIVIIGVLIFKYIVDLRNQADKQDKATMISTAQAQSEIYRRETEEASCKPILWFKGISYSDSYTQIYEVLGKSINLVNIEGGYDEYIPSNVDYIMYSDDIIFYLKQDFVNRDENGAPDLVVVEILDCP